jgi:hypothetical protein
MIHIFHLSNSTPRKVYPISGEPRWRDLIPLDTDQIYFAFLIALIDDRDGQTVAWIVKDRYDATVPKQVTIEQLQATVADRLLRFCNPKLQIDFSELTKAMQISRR